MNEIFRMFFHRTNKYMYSEKTFAVIEKNNVYVCFYKNYYAIVNKK